MAPDVPQVDRIVPQEIAVAVIERDGMFLVGKRPEGVPLAGYHEFPGGKVQPGEQPAEAARRECLEETGLDIRVGARYPEVVYPYDHAVVRLHFFAAEVLDPAAAPTAPFVWAPRAELAKLTFPPANDALIAWLLSQSS